MIESLSSKNLPAPRFRYSPLVKSGPFYKTAGMIALDKDSGELEPGGAGPETAKILKNLLETAKILKNLLEPFSAFSPA